MINFIPKEHQLWVNTPHGVGLAIAAESFAHDNYLWTVILAEDGRILHYNSLQLRASIHHTMEINLKDVQPTFPTDKQP